jgi:hypothetical protein
MAGDDKRIGKPPPIAFGVILGGHQPTSLFSTHGSFLDHTTATQRRRTQQGNSKSRLELK